MSGNIGVNVLKAFQDSSSPCGSMSAGILCARFAEANSGHLANTSQDLNMDSDLTNG